MKTKYCVRHVYFAMTVTLCIASSSTAAAADPIWISGKVVTPDGEPVEGVTIRRWASGNLMPPDPKPKAAPRAEPAPAPEAAPEPAPEGEPAPETEATPKEPTLDEAGKNYQSIRGGVFRLPAPPSVDAILFDHKEYHIKVKALPKGKSGPLDWKVVMYRTKYDSADELYAPSTLRFSQIANEYEKLALLALTADEFTRRFISFEFEKMEVGPRLERLQLPAEPKESKPYLKQSRERILDLFESLRGMKKRALE